MSHEVITIDDDDDSLQQQQSRQQQRQQQQQERVVCIACTFRNESGATVCCVCETPLVDDVQRGNGDQSFVEQQHGLPLEAAANFAECGESGISSALIPTSANLKARTIAEGGDRQAATPGLIPRIHGRLLGEQNTRSRGNSNKDGGRRGNAATPDPEAGGIRERQTLLRREGGLDLCFANSSSKGDGGMGTGRGRGRGAEAVWRLCDPRTVHCTQRRLHGSRFSCGYRNIQMLCSALMEWPEYKRVLFGGSGCIPGVALLQCWIERAWADGYDPQGCEQLGGPGALMGSETWIGATECATLLRSFGVKAEVIDFESTAPSVQAGEARPQSDFETTTHFAGGVGGDDTDRSHNSTKRKMPGSVSLCSSSRWPSPAQANGGSGPLDQQQCIRSFLPLSNPDGRTAVTSQTSVGRSRTSRAWEPGETKTSPVEEAARDRHGTEQRFGTGVAGGSGWGRRNDAASGGRNEHGAGRSSVRSGGRGGGRGRPPASRGGRRGGRKISWKSSRRGSIGKDAGDRMGQALAEWAWEYFCTPWGTTEEGDSSAGRSSAAGAAGLRSLPLPAPSQLREPGDSGPEVVAPCAVGGRSQRPEPTGWRGSTAPTLPPTTAISSSSSSLSAGAAVAAAELSRQKLGHKNDADNDVVFFLKDGGNRQAAGPGRPGAGSASGSAAPAAAFANAREKARQERPPPPLYFQHDGHSRSVVGVLWPGGKAASHVNERSGNGQGGGGGGRAESARCGGRGWRGGHGTGGRRQPGNLLVFDPSHEGKELRNALDNTQKPGWGRFLKRGEHALHRRQFQIVAIRPGLVEPRQANAWKTIVSEKVCVD